VSLKAKPNISWKKYTLEFVDFTLEEWQIKWYEQATTSLQFKSIVPSMYKNVSNAKSMRTSYTLDLKSCTTSRPYGPSPCGEWT